jgi:hypothetical protein
MSSVIYLKWSPSVKDQFHERSKLQDKPIVVGNNVMETILQEGHDFIKNESKRENHFHKINERELVAQTNMNPFMSSNYLEDLQVQEEFLTPQNSNSIQNEKRN